MHSSIGSRSVTWRSSRMRRSGKEASDPVDVFGGQLELARSQDRVEVCRPVRPAHGAVAAREHPAERERRHLDATGGRLRLELLEAVEDGVVDVTLVRA